MNRNDLSGRIAERVGITKKDAERFIEAYEDIVTEALITGDEVNLHSFVNYQVKMTAERTGRNPSTGEPMTIPSSKKVKVKVSPVLNKKLS